MSITLIGAGGLFTIIKKVITAADAIELAYGTTLETNIELVLAEMADIASVDGGEFAAPLATAVRSFRSTTSIQSAIKTFVQELLIDRVRADVSAVPEKLSDCIDELIRQMRSSGDDVDGSTSTATVVLPGTNPPTLLCSVTDDEGYNLQDAIDEVLVGTYSSPTSLKITSGKSQSNKLAYDWPLGSAVNKTISVEEDGLLLNHSFDDQDDRATTPDDWVIVTGTIGTTIDITSSEVQTATVTGVPTTGYWTLSHTNNNGDVQTTVPLAFDCEASDVEAALGDFVGWTDVTVTEAVAGVFTINFNAVNPPGDQALLVAEDNFDVGSMTIAQVTAGENAYEYNALAILGTAAVETTTLRQAAQELGLEANGVYAFSIQAKRIAATTGTLYIEFVNGAGTVMTNDAGTNLRTTIDIATISDSAFGPHTGWFQLPDDLPEIFYIQIRFTDLADTKGVYLDDFILAAATQLYADGPYVALFPDDRDIQDDDRYTITLTNDWAGKVQKWFYRWFGRVLPFDTGGTETITDP